jgi:hypothetical protein
MSGLLPVIGPVAWGQELLALGATPVVIAVLDTSCADWRQWRESRRSFSAARHAVALALAVLGIVSAVNLAPAAMPGGTSTSTFNLFWLFLLAFTTVTCAAFITSGGERTSSGVLAGILAWVGFCLPPLIALTIMVFNPPVGAGLFAVVAYYIFGLLLTGVVVSALLVAPLAGLLGGWLRR